MFQRHWLHGAELLQSSQVDVKQEDRSGRAGRVDLCSLHCRACCAWYVPRQQQLQASFARNLSCSSQLRTCSRPCNRPRWGPAWHTAGVHRSIAKTHVE